MANQKLFGWTLIMLGIVLLAAFGNLSLLAALIPISLLLGYGTFRTGSNENQADIRRKKGIA